MNLRINQTVKVTKKCKTNECLSLDSPEAGPDFPVREMRK